MKKILVFLICFNTSFAQKFENLTRLEYSKAYNEVTDCSCNLFRDEQYANVVKEEILNCENLVLELINFKKNLKQLRSIKACCPTEKGHWNLGCESYYNRLVYQFNKFTDTIFFNNDNKSTEIYTKYRTYFDNKNLLLKIIQKNDALSNLNKIDLDRKFIEYNETPNDSISSEKITINNSNLYNKKREEISSLVKIENNYDYFKDFGNHRNNVGIYTLYNNRIDSYLKIIIKENQPISSFELIESSSSSENSFEYFIDGNNVGDDVKKLITKYPSSTKHIENLSKYFKNNNSEYDYEILVNITKNVGLVIFQIKDNKIYKIIVNYK